MSERCTHAIQIKRNGVWEFYEPYIYPLHIATDVLAEVKANALEEHEYRIITI